MSGAPDPDFSIVVANWNGASFLRRGLGSLILSAHATHRPHEIIVVDDASTDDSPSLIEKEFPSVRLIRHHNNQGFGITANDGVRAARAKIVVLCNNDLIAREEFIPHLLAPLSNSAIFAVSGKTIDWEDGKPNHIEMHAVWRNGLLAQYHSDPMEPVETTFFQGGACACRRDVFLQLGGFCPIFEPGYWEDYDLGYLARKAGWRILYEPRAIAIHLGKASMSARYGRDRLEIILRRNQILFTWLNLSDSALWLRHCFQFPIALLRDLARTENSPLAKGFIRAVPLVGKVFAERLRRRSELRKSDREIIQ